MAIQTRREYPWYYTQDFRDRRTDFDFATRISLQWTGLIVFIFVAVVLMIIVATAPVLDTHSDSSPIMTNNDGVSGDNDDNKVEELVVGTFLDQN